MDFRNHDADWDDDTVKEKGDPMCNYLPHKKERIDDMEFLPDGYPLHKV